MRALGAGRIYLLNRTRRGVEELDHAIPEANVELLDMLDVASVQGPPPSVVLSTVPASGTTTEEHVPDALFLPSLFSADVGVGVNMAYKPTETPLLRLGKTVAGGGWRVASGTR